jgi:sarcosine/dimethylglycine N-methyltransferase
MTTVSQRKWFRFCLRKCRNCVRDFYLWIVLIALIVLFSIYVISECVSHNGSAPKWHTQSVMNALAIFGTVFTLWGVLLTYAQLRRHYDKINGYDDFYSRVEQLLDEVLRDPENCSYFYYYGPTILPGNVASDDECRVTRFKEKIELLFGNAKYKNLRRKLIVPENDAYFQMYTPMVDYPLTGVKLDSAHPEAWRRYVERQRNDAIAFQDSLCAHASKDSYITVFRVPVSDRRIQDIDKSYFFCTATRLVYAMPLHYSNARDGERSAYRTPRILGFASAEKNDVRAFKERFEQLTDGLNQDLLHFMYGRHIISPPTLREYIKLRQIPIKTSSLDILAAVDHDHFGGKSATDECIKAIGIGSGSLVLDIGSGLGGPARYTAHKKGCHVTAVEIQKDRHTLAHQITQKMGLTDRVDLVCADVTSFLKNSTHTHKYTHVVAFLSILHLERKREALRLIGEVLQKGGQLWIDDFCLGSNSPNERDMREFLACPGLLSWDEYACALEDGGIALAAGNPIDMTDDWSRAAKERYDLYEQAQRTGTPLQEPCILAGTVLVDAFRLYGKIHQMFQCNAIHGVRIIGTKN